MSELKDYSINFKGLKEGSHLFEFDLGSDFFSLWEDSFYSQGDIKAKVVLSKSQQMLKFEYSLKGKVVANCDNCLTPVDVKLDSTFSQHVKFGEQYEELDDDIIVISRAEHEINIAKYLYDIIVTSLPIRNVHPLNEDGQAGCDPAMMEALSGYLIGGETITGTDDSITYRDPRWDALMKLTDKKTKKRE